MNKTLSMVLTLGAVLLAAPAWAGGERPIDERRPLKADARVNVDNVAGLIEVEAWDKRELQLTGTLSEDAERLEISGDESSLSIQVKLPFISRNPGETTLRLKVPAGISLDAEGVSADIRVRGLTGPVKVDSVSGDVVMDVASKRVSAGTVSGDITLQTAAEETRVATVSGDITVRGTARGELRGESVSGDLQVQAGELRELDLESVSGDLEVAVDLTRDSDVSVETLSGNVVLTLARLPESRIEMETFSGEVTSAWPASGRSAKEGRHGHDDTEVRHDGGGPGRVRLHSFSGDIELKKK